jgi:hypothetical protein
MAERGGRPAGNGGASYPSLLDDPIFTAGLDELLNSATTEWPEPEPDDYPLVDAVLDLKREIEALRREMSSTRPSFGGCRFEYRRLDDSALTHLQAHLDLRTSVLFHQLCRVIEGKPPTVKNDVFPDTGGAEIEGHPRSLVKETPFTGIDLAPVIDKLNELGMALAAYQDRDLPPFDLSPVLAEIAAMRASLTLGFDRLNDHFARLLGALLAQAEEARRRPPIGGPPYWPEGRPNPFSSSLTRLGSPLSASRRNRSTSTWNTGKRIGKRSPDFLRVARLERRQQLWWGKPVRRADRPSARTRLFTTRVHHLGRCDPLPYPAGVPAARRGATPKPCDRG